MVPVPVVWNGTEAPLKNLYKCGQIRKFSNHHDPLPPPWCFKQQHCVACQPPTDLPSAPCSSARRVWRDSWRPIHQGSRRYRRCLGAAEFGAMGGSSHGSWLATSCKPSIYTTQALYKNLRGSMPFQGFANLGDPWGSTSRNVIQRSGCKYAYT